MVSSGPLWLRIQTDVREAIRSIVRQWPVEATDVGTITITTSTGQREIVKIRGTLIEPGDQAIVLRLGRLEIAVGSVSTKGEDDRPQATGGGGTMDHYELIHIGTYTHDELDAFADATTAHAAAVNPHGTAAVNVGLGNVTNTSDANKPVSTAQQTALDLKQDISTVAELIRDTIGTALVAGSGIGIAVNDAGDTITLTAGTSGFSSDRVATSQTTTLATGTDLTDMAFTVGASEEWAYEFNMQIGNNGVGGVKFDLTIPASATIRGHAWGHAGSQANYRSDLMSAGSTLSGAFLTVALTSGLVRVYGTILTAGTSGTVQLRFASTTGGDMSTVYAGSYFRAWKIA